MKFFDIEDNRTHFARKTADSSSIILVKTVYNNGKIKKKENDYVSDSQTYRDNSRR